MEEEIKAEPEQGDGASKEGESSADVSSRSPMKRARGRPQGSKKLKVCVTDINLLELVSGISNGGSTQPLRGRGRPKLSGTKHTVQEGSGDSHADDSVQTHKASNGDDTLSDHTPKKRGRPKKSPGESIPEKAAAGDLPNGGSATPKRGRGRPKGSVKRKSESLASSEEGEGGPVTPRRRGRPKGSLNKKPRLLAEVSSEGEEETDGSLNSPKRGRGRLRKVVVNYSGRSTQNASNGIAPQRRRGRPRKSVEQKSRDQQELVTGQTKRGRGRPKGSLNKKPPVKKVHGKVGRPRTVHVAPVTGRRGRPRLQPAKRGRPRKYPLPSPEDLKKPKVWKPLGRPRKYPRVDPPEGALPAPRRSRGRPRKAESRKGAHLRKSVPNMPSSLRNPNDGPPRKRGRPRTTQKSEDVAPRKKRGRPKGSVNKNKGRSETQLDGAKHSKEKSDSPAVEVECEGEPVEAVVEHDVHETEETLIEQDANFEVSDQA
ncbi:putative ABC transporter F family member 4-like [Scophthalmus maximus]|uniref:Putative ABC transporter F family member 4-like n=1 Tax=Scophthalmus maximus TaxID=52904 RepID=A0A2U9CY28_SCOMX|nr:putative ABC transporter F family member 4-like [Scophthalmus maximus]